MSFYNKELNGFNEIYSYVVSHNDGIYKLVYDNKIQKCSFETCYESDDGLDDTESNYDEFEVIVFYDLKNKFRFEINYKNIPNEVYHNDKLIFKKIIF